MSALSNKVREPSRIPFSKEHTEDAKLGKEGDLIPSITFVIFVPVVVSHCSRTLCLGAFAGDFVYYDDYALTRFGPGDKRTLAL